VVKVHDPLNLESINMNQLQLTPIHMKVPSDYSKIQPVALLLVIRLFGYPICNASNWESFNRMSVCFSYKINPYMLWIFVVGLILNQNGSQVS